MPKTLVHFHSRTGNTSALADAIAEGVRQVRFAEVDVLRLADLAPAHVIDGDPRWKAGRDRMAAAYRTLESVEALTGYDAIVVGAPARYGAMTPELKAFFDQAAPLAARGALADRVGSAFTSVATQLDGRRHTVWSMLEPLASLGMILVPPGAMAAEPHRDGPTGDDLAAARAHGKRVATVAAWVRHAKSHEHQAAHEHAGHHH
jgi:NAD(P)H dehydrogenase (quinone)